MLSGRVHRSIDVLVLQGKGEIVRFGEMPARKPYYGLNLDTEKQRGISLTWKMNIVKLTL